MNISHRTEIQMQPSPLTHRLSWITAGLAGAVSLAGLLWQSTFYPTEALRRAFVPNDVVTLALILPALLASQVLARRGRLLGQLLWPGALFALTYNFTIYALAMPGSGLFFPYLILVTLSLVALFLLLTGLGAPNLARRLRGAIQERLCGGVLAGLGLLFFARSVGALAGAFSAPFAITPELATTLADLVTTPVWAAAGVLLWRRHPYGYAAAPGLLFQSSLLFAGLLVYFLLQPALTGAAFPLADFIVILAMSLVCFVPLGRMVTGIGKA